jgi:predicted nucleotidyltransferase
MLKVRANRPLDSIQLDALRYLNAWFKEQETDYFIIGATARDIVLTHVFGIPPTRVTVDIDFALALTSWDAFQGIRQALLDTGRFGESRGAIHSLVFEPNDAGFGYPIDLIPFGQIESPAREIAWPPDYQVIMNVGGYREAMAAAETVEVAPGETVKVCSLPGLAIIKLLAWAERGLADPGDARDFQVLLKEYANAGNLNRLYEGDGLALLTDAGFDPDLAGAQLIGQDCRRLASRQTLDDLQAILVDPSRRNRLILHMSSNRTANASAYLDNFEKGLFP